MTPYQDKVVIRATQSKFENNVCKEWRIIWLLPLWTTEIDCCPVKYLISWIKMDCIDTLLLNTGALYNHESICLKSLQLPNYVMIIWISEFHVCWHIDPFNNAFILKYSSLSRIPNWSEILIHFLLANLNLSEQLQTSLILHVRRSEKRAQALMMTTDGNVLNAGTLISSRLSRRNICFVQFKICFP